MVSETGKEVEMEEQAMNVVNVTKGRSWVYNYAEKIGTEENTMFHCRFEFKSGKKCQYKVLTKKGQTSNIAAHLKEKHGLKAPPKQIQASMDSFISVQPKKKTFREAFAEMVAKQYLPCSFIEEKSVQESYLAFLMEYGIKAKEHNFVTDKAVAADVSHMAEKYVQVISKRFTSRLSLCMDVWTGPNRMSFLGISFTYLDDDFVIQRGLLDMVKMRQNYSGEYIAGLFQGVMDLYGIKKNMIAGITKNNTSNWGTCSDFLVSKGYDRHIFHGCFLNVLNLACQAAIKVYDPSRKKKTVRTKLVRVDDFSGSEDSQDEPDEDYENDEYAKEIQEVENRSNVISKARKLAVFISHNDLYREMFAECQRRCQLDTTLLVKDLKVRWNTTAEMIKCLIKNEQAFTLLPEMDPTVPWPILNDEEWVQLKELCPLLALFEDLTLHYSKTPNCRMSDACLDFEELLVEIKSNFLEKKEAMPERLWYAANSAYTKLMKYCMKIGSVHYALATVLDPRYKLAAYVITQDPVALKETAKVAIELAFKDYSLKYGQRTTDADFDQRPLKKGRYVDEMNLEIEELDLYLQEPRIRRNVDPLDYWRVNKERFPILAKIARDFLALQPTSKDVAGTFAKGRRTIPYYRQSQNLRNQMLVNSGFHLGIFQ
jgi:hypothetical protein